MQKAVAADEKGRSGDMTGATIDSDLPRVRVWALILALVISTAGDEIALVVLALKVSDRANTMVGVSLLLAAGLLPGVLLAPLVGRVADAVAPVPLLVGVLLIQAVVALGMAASGSDVVLIALAVVLGALGAVAAAAVMVVVPRLVADERLTGASSAIEISRNVGYLVGPALAGVLVEVGGTWLGLVANAVSFAVAAALTPLLPATARHNPITAPCSEVDRPPRARWTEGFRLLVKDPLLRRVLPVIVVTVCTTSMFNVALVFHVRQGLGLPEGVYGLLVFGISAGLVAGPLLLRVPLRRVDSAVLAVVCAGGIGAAMAASAFLVPLAAVFGCLLVLGVANAGQNVALRTVIMRRSPESKRGAVGAGYAATLQGAVVIGFLLAAAPPPAASQLVIAVGGVIAILAGGVGLVLLGAKPSTVYPALMISDAVSVAEQRPAR